MVAKLLIAWVVMLACVVMHAMGTIVIVRGLIAPRLSTIRGLLSAVWLLIVVVTCFAAVHLAEIALWALLYQGMDSMPNMETALYFSAVTYTTVGYGDVVLPLEWRLAAGIEALTGILMVGWTSALIFFVLVRVRAALEAAGHVAPFTINPDSDIKP